VLGDSLVATTYNVRAVVQTEGTRLVEVTAGSYKVPDCREVITNPNAPGQTVCT
jgi:hypothetical protein